MAVGQPCSIPLAASHLGSHGRPGNANGGGLGHHTDADAPCSALAGLHAELAALSAEHSCCTGVLDPLKVVKG
jgi:hypothetical protein